MTKNWWQPFPVVPQCGTVPLRGITKSSVAESQAVQRPASPADHPDGARERRAPGSHLGRSLTRATEGFTKVKDELGPEGFAVFSCSKSTNEMNYAAQKFARMALGTNNIDSCNRT